MLRAPSISSARRATLRIGVVLTALTIGTGGVGIASANAATQPATVTTTHSTTTHHTTSGHPTSIKPVLHGRAAVDAHRASFGKSVLAIAAHYAGRPYSYGATGPGAFDCSGFTRYVFGQVGVSLAHSSFSQYSEVRHIPQSQAAAGDIVFLNGLGHVGIYAGHGMMWDAPSPGGVVSLRPIYSSAYQVGRVND